MNELYWAVRTARLRWYSSCVRKAGPYFTRRLIRSGRLSSQADEFRERRTPGSTGEREHLVDEAEVALAEDLAAHVLVLRERVFSPKGIVGVVEGISLANQVAADEERRRRAEEVRVGPAEQRRPADLASGRTEIECGRP